MRARPYQLANERLLGAESMPLAGEHGELCSLKRDFFAGGLTGHDARSVIVCRKKPVADRDRVLHHVGALGARELRHLVDERGLAFGQDGLDASHVRFSTDSVRI